MPANGRNRRVSPIAARPGEGALAADLVARKVDLIAAPNDVLAHGAKGATSTIPIVFLYGGDPVADGLVASLARPGGNLTGVSNTRSMRPGTSLCATAWS